MLSQPTRTSTARPVSPLLIVAWVATLLAGFLPVILWREGFSGTIADTLPFRIAVLLVLLLLSLGWKAIAPLRKYFVIILAIYAGEEILRPWIEARALWQGWFGTGQASPFLVSLGGAGLRLLMALVPWAALVLMGYRRADYFLVKGDLNALAEPVRWLDIKEGQRWQQVGRQFLLVFSLVVLIIFVMVMRPGLKDLGQILVLLPAAVLLAGMNAFTENFAFRAAVLPQLLPVVGKRQAILLAAVFFGLPHFYGFPPGLGGPILAGFLGWVLGKAMVETRGFLWAWLIQLPLDIMAIMTMLMVSM